MFSEDFTVAEKHSLIRQEYVSTYSYMPWQYTSLYDSQYDPELDQSIKRKLEQFCRYRFVYSTTVLRDEGKLVKIEHNNNTILSYEIINPFKYYEISGNIPAWRHLSSSIQCEELYNCKEAIEKMTDVTDEQATWIKSIEYDDTCNFKNVTVYDPTYNLSEYTDNHVLNKLNYISSRSEEEILYAISLYPNSKKIKLKIIPAYCSVRLLYDGVRRKPTIYDNPLNSDVLKWCLGLLKRHECITEDQIQYIDSLCNENTRCDFEIELGEDGEIEDFCVLVYKTYEFKSLGA